MHKKKSDVIIVTIISENYGNRLQNYALQKVLENLGFENETMPIKVKYTLKYKIKLIIKTCLSTIIKKYKDVCWDWFDQNINWSKFTADTPNIANSYRFFIAGSDQIWNPTFNCNSEREFLPFAQPEQKIAYAASIGLAELPTEYKTNYANAISSFHAVSVRENAGAKIIENLIDEKVPVVLDPTMLLSTNEWMKVIKKSKLNINKKYIVKYFLGIRNTEYDNCIKNYAERNGCIIIDITKPPVNLEKKIGPGEFVNLIAYSQAVFTDSFHGTVFSILFHRPFIVFERPFEVGYGEMNSRLDTLLTTFELEGRRINSADQFDLIDFACKFDKTDKILKKRRYDSIAYLRNALAMEDKMIENTN